MKSRVPTSEDRLSPHPGFLGELEHLKIVVYYESIKRELKIRPIFECRCDDRLKTKADEFTCLELEHLKIKTSLIHEKFCECDG